LADAERAVELGADAIGFIFAKSPRRISPEKAKEITRRISPFVKTVGVFVNEASSTIREIVHICGLDLIQLHGNETVSDCAELGPGVIKAFRVTGEETLSRITPYRGHVRAILLDSYQKGLDGGTGKTFDWHLACRAKTCGIAMVLSGGLNPENVQEALNKVNPSAIDISSGVEERPGIKDHELIRLFMEKVRDFAGPAK